jgi:hypothetical protein
VSATASPWHIVFPDASLIGAGGRVSYKGVVQ